MGYARINKKSITDKILRSKKAHQAAEEKAKKIMLREKKELMQAFDNHPFTQEIEAGAKADNISGSLGGYGNLFSFIGFVSRTKPVAKVRSLLQNIDIYSSKLVKEKYYVTVKYPSQDEIRKASPMPWENGLSWVEGLEKGISGFTDYIYKRFIKGRSKEALQSEGRNRSGNFQKRDYLFSMLSVFAKRIKGGKGDYPV